MKRLSVKNCRYSPFYGRSSGRVSVTCLLLVAALLTANAQAQTQAQTEAIDATPLTPSSIQSAPLEAAPRVFPEDDWRQSGASSMDVTLGKSTLLKLPAPIKRISVGSPNVADVIMINPREVYILGKLVGMTNLTLWTRDGNSRVIDVRVQMDAVALQDQLSAVMPDEPDIEVTAAGDSLILNGFVSNTIRVDRAVALADAFVRTSVLNMMVSLQDGAGDADAGGQGGQGGGQQGMQALRQGIKHDEDSEGAGSGLGSFRVINLLQVRDNQQVMLEVKVAELNRTQAEKLGFDFAGAARKTGSAWTQIMAGLAGGGPANFLLGKNLTAEVESGLPRVNNFQADEGAAFLVDAEKRDEIIKVLAEPNIVAISGQEASFLVGGEILIPVFSGAGGNVRLQSKQFGVGLNFIPTVLEKGRINLRVNPEVSELVSFESVASTGLGGIVAVPTFKTRRISTTVQLRDGQSLAIGGLLQDDFREQMKRFPVLGEVPVLGALFSSNNFRMEKTELVVLVTPRLVQPMQPDHALPTDAFNPPGRGEFFLQGKLEGRPPSAPQAEGEDALTEDDYRAVETEAGGFQMK